MPNHHWRSHEGCFRRCECAFHPQAFRFECDDAIREAQRLLWKHLRVVAEPGGAAALAALVSRAWEPANGQSVGVLLCGANTTAVSFS